MIRSNVLPHGNADLNCPDFTLNTPIANWWVDSPDAVGSFSPHYAQAFAAFIHG